MDIRPNASISAVAGTARAQVHGTDNDRSPAGGGVAESRRNQDNAMVQSERAEDRDADGRQLYDFSSNHKHASDEESSKKQPPSANEPHALRHAPDINATQGNQLDFDA